MKQIFTIALCIGVSLSCQKNEIYNGQEPEESAKVSVTVPNATTKVLDIGDDSQVHNIQVFAFKSSGELDAYGQSTTSSVDLTCTTGPKQIYAIVNAPNLSTINDLSSLLSASSNLADNKVGSLIMVKDTSLHLTADVSLNLKVKRLAARICLKSIKNSMASIQHRNLNFKVNAVYLINVVGDRQYFTTSSPLIWYNQLTNKSELARLLYDNMGGHNINYGESYTTKHYFYCYPNSQTEDSSLSLWSPRYTRLVLEANLGGQLCYYPVSIPNVQQNKAYSVSLVLTLPGSTSPDEPIEKLTQGITIEVEDWDMSEDILETI